MGRRSALGQVSRQAAIEELRNKFGDPMFEPEVFQKQTCCFEISAYDIVVTFWPPTVIRYPGYYSPLHLFVTPMVLCNKNQKIL